MKKIILWTLALIFLLAMAYIFGSKMYVQNKFKSDHEYVEKVMLQKDSENRGYSDIVKQKIENKFVDEELRISLKKEAAQFRKIIQSKTRKEFVENSQKGITLQACTNFILRKESIDDFDGLDGELLSDNDEMFQYYQYLSLVRFGDTLTDIMYYNNDHPVENQEDYNKLCH